jgi:hypothetical protein
VAEFVAVRASARGAGFSDAAVEDVAESLRFYLTAMGNAAALEGGLLENAA